MSRRHVWVPALLALTLGAVACGSDNKDSGSSAATTGAATTAAASATTAAGASATTGAASGQATAGVTADSITLGIIAAKSGPFGDAVKDVFAGYQIWAAETNANGGINGRQIKIKEYDHGETADGGVAACKNVIADGDVFLPISTQGLQAHLTSANCFDEAGITNMVWQAGTDFVDKWTHTYSLLADPKVQGEVAGTYIKARTTADDKVAFAITSTDIYRVAGDAMKAKAEELGVNVVDAQYLEQTGTTFIPQLQHMKDAGATVVALSSILIESTVIKEAESIGFSPKFTGYGYAFNTVSGAAPDVYQDLTGVAITVPVTTGAAYEHYVEMAKQYAPQPCSAACDSQFQVYGFAKTIGHVLETAGPDLNQETLVKSLESVKDFDDGNGTTPPITWTATQHVGTTSMYPVKCCDGKGGWLPDGTPTSDFTKS